MNKYNKIQLIFYQQLSCQAQKHTLGTYHNLTFNTKEQTAKYSIWINEADGVEVNSTASKCNHNQQIIFHMTTHAPQLIFLSCHPEC